MLERNVVFGCGDIGRRICRLLSGQGTSPSDIRGYVNTQISKLEAAKLGVDCDILDLDKPTLELSACANADLFYTVAPQKEGVQDLRSKRVIDTLKAQAIHPRKVVLISTTGVYGDCKGDWVTEATPAMPQTERGQRRLDSEQQWLAWGKIENVDVVILRVPGIYAYSRLPRARLEKATPVVAEQECGFTNRIHADDLANMCIQAMSKAENGKIYNATDGQPGKISEYLQAAAQALGLPPLPEISMDEAKSQLSVGMLSYLSESRKISNQKMIEELDIQLAYPDFRVGLLK